MRYNRSALKIISKGFTLIETIVGIVVLAISFSLITTLIYPLVEQSADQLHQIKASELGQSILNEIQNKAFDENSDKTGGLVRCGENTIVCTTNDNLGCESHERNASNACVRYLFDDVDDYNDVVLFENSLSEDLSNLYLGYAVKIEVCNDADYDGICTGSEDNFVAKLITVTITTPTGFDIVFSTYRANF